MPSPANKYRRNSGVNCPPSQRQGFALIVALAMMGFLLLMLVALAAFVEVETRRQQGELHQFAARTNALLGLRLALAELQKAAGPDTRVTARADIITTDAGQLASGARYWTGVWDTLAEEGDAGEPVWLISGLKDGTPFTGLHDEVRKVVMVGDGTAAEEVAAGVVESPQEDGGTVASQYAWWIGDEGVKAKVNVVSEAPSADSEQNLPLLMTPRRFGIENITDFDGFSDLIAESGSELQRIARLGQLKWLNKDVDHRERYFDLTTNSYGVLANTRDGGLRRDLTARMDFKATNDPVWSTPVWEVVHEGMTLEGPKWSLIRDFSLLVDSTADPANASGAGFPVLPIQLSRSYGTYPRYADPQVYPTRSGLNPMLMFTGMTYGITAVEIALLDSDVEDSVLYAPKRDGLQRSFRLILAMKPVVVLWNPYDVAIESKEGYVVYYNSRNDASHLFGPRIRMQNTSTDLVDSKGKPVTRNVIIPGIMPGAPQPEHPVRSIKHEVWGYDSSGYTVRSYNPRFSIKGPITLLPGEVAFFSLPAGTRDLYGFTDADGSDTPPNHKEVQQEDGRGGPELERGFRPDTYVWTYIYGPVASSGSSDQPTWNGSSGDLGRVDFWDEGIEEVVKEWTDPGVTHSYSATDVTVVRNYPITLSFGQSRGGQFGPELYKGRMMWMGDKDRKNVINAHFKDNLMLYAWTGQEETTAMTFEFYSADEFANTLVDVDPIHFSSWGVVLSTPGWDNPRKLLAHFNPRATVHHSFYAENFGMKGTFLGPVLHVEAEGGQGVPHIIDMSKIFPDDAMRTIDYDGESRTIGPILFHVPRNELISIGQLAHLEMARNCWGPTYVVGNSYALPWFPPEETVVTVRGISPSTTTFPNGDETYLTNEALWDDYFFSTYDIDRETKKESPLNPRLKILDSAVRFSNVSEPEYYAATNMVIDGPFNVNSTSVEAWKAVLSSLNQLALPFAETGEGPTSWSTMEIDSPYPRTSQLSVYGGVPTHGSLDFQSWRDIPALTPEQVDVIATRIVYELRSRGKPFFSLAQFINREPDGDNKTAHSTRDPRMMGLLQRVFDADYDETDLVDGEPLHADAGQFNPINPRGGSADRVEGFPETSVVVNYPAAHSGLRATGVPGYLLQSDLLQVLGPIISTRSDTFVIRAYGELPGVSDAGGAPIARAWCEAIVQRMPDYVDGSLKAMDDAGTSELAAVFGRQFRVVSFRWLSPDEI